MDTLEFILNLKNVNRISTVNPSSISTILKTFQNGEFEPCQDEIRKHIDDSKVIDVYVLFICFSIDLNQNVSDISMIIQRLTKYHNILKLHSQHLSPINRFNEALKRGIELFSKSLLMIINDKKGASQHFEVKPLIDYHEYFIDFCSSLGNIEVAELDKANEISVVLRQLEYLFEQKSAKKEANKQNEAVEKKQNNQEEIEKETQCQNKIQKNEEENFHNPIYGEMGQIDKFASSSWYVLVNKIGMFQLLIKEKRLFEAAIVYKDVQSELAKFEPKKYFPGLFFPFYQALAPNAEQVHNFMNKHSKTLQWDIANNLYEMDSNRFLKELPLKVENVMKDDGCSGVQYAEESNDSFNEGQSYNDVNDPSARVDENENLMEHFWDED
ncbi:type VI secretion system protein IglI family protein [uncultured Shewanella sp.]|uniref:type VI secretion system protein IglI family protein n=1 Tax=uncultured Shewanella sp. TaxID=173975 RepID=UPI00260C3293|nr:type VI secretion system protein IglI family protein [uncultured Shewanella sp.]